MSRPVSVPNARKFIKLAQDLGLAVTGFEVLPGGGFRVLTAQEQQDAADSDLDRWLRTQNG